MNKSCRSLIRQYIDYQPMKYATHSFRSPPKHQQKKSPEFEQKQLTAKRAKQKRRR
jgi:hypothetical protein